jgi:adenylosuccinate lyase
MAAGCIWGATTQNITQTGDIGRQHAHDVVYEAAQAAASQNISFPERLAADTESRSI